MESLLIINPYTMNSAFINILLSFILNWLDFVIQYFFSRSHGSYIYSEYVYA